MKALTVWQPWAGLIVGGLKPLENRGWEPSLEPGERFAIHAGSGSEENVHEWLLDEMTRRLTPMAARLCLVKGAIIGTVRYLGVVRKAEDLVEEDRKWFAGPLGWRLADPKPIASDSILVVQFYACKGKLGLWDVPAEALDLLV